MNHEQQYRNIAMLDGVGAVQLSGFGLSVQAEHESSSGSLGYLLPLVKPSIKADVYALGMIFYRMLIGELPRRCNGTLQRGRRFKALPRELQQLLRAMLEVDPEARLPSVSGVSSRLSALNGAMDTACWAPVKPKAVILQRRHERKKLLLLMLLVLFFMVLLNTGLITLLGRDNFLEAIFTLL